jgi:hypothetical protein
MNKTRLMSAILTVVMLFGMLGALPVYAKPVNTDAEGLATIKYTTEVFATPQDKLDTMVLWKDQNGFQMYVEDYSGEVAIVNKATGQIMFSNPFDVAGDTASESTKTKLLSQVVIKYQDNGTDKEMNSFTEAAQRLQINVKNIKNGVRVEYTMGREETRKLVPRLIEKSRFENDILANIVDDSWSYEKLRSFYTEKNPNDPALTERGVKEMQAKFPITNKMAVYVCDPDIKDRELNQCEGIIKGFCPTYTYESLDEDHAMTEYEGMDRAPALFKLALEYTLDDEGLMVRLPANGIRYDESNYKLKSITVLPYMGAGSYANTGYTFMPDGSGAIFRFEDLKGSSPYNVAGKIYGQDYAYHEITGEHIEAMRLPVYGIVENYKRTDTVTHEELVAEESVDPETGEIIPAQYTTISESVPYAEDKGLFAIITEGDALAELTSEHGGTLHRYNSVYPTFYPRPSDQYNLADSISIGSNATWTVELARKYVGSYRIKYIMLGDETLAQGTPHYEASYVGMANAYRDYLEKTGVIAPLETVKADTPIYIESFGSVRTEERVLTFPVMVDLPLTTFENIQTMHEELSAEGVSNINFRLSGFANGGFKWSTMPYRLKWMKVLGGEKGFESLLDYARANDIGIYPDFDFAYIDMMEFGDGTSLKKHAVRTIDDRYTRKRVYDSAMQSFDFTFLLCVSPSVFDYFYTKFSSNYIKNDPIGLSVASLGTDLNSDFNKRDPYNREDSRAFTTDVLAKMKDEYKNIMIDGGNAYALQYSDHILNAALDSSRFNNSSNSVPFLGMVLHGYKNFTGTPINMEGDIEYAILKTIENGASLFFTLSYQNTAELKEWSMFNQYYSVRYDIWFNDVVQKYQYVNELLKDVQTSKISEHEFLIGERIPDEIDAAIDAAAEQALLEAEAEKEALALEKEEKAKQLAIRLGEAPEEVVEEEVLEDELAEGEVAEGDEVVEEEVEAAYVVTKYTSDDGSIVRVGYENGKSLILNYNSFAVTTVYNGTTYTIEPLGLVVIK